MNKNIDIFYQGEGVSTIEHVELDEKLTFAKLKQQLKTKHGFCNETLLFLEDADGPVDEATHINDHAIKSVLKVHFSRRRKVTVKVSFNGETVERRFAPSATLTRIKRWATKRKFHMSEEDASEHVLQIEGNHTRPPVNTHVGCLVTGPHARVCFDLVPDERVNGAASV